MAHALLNFSLVALTLVLTPGPDFAVVVSNALRSRTAGLATASGTASGLAGHALIAAAGLSAVLLASDTAYATVKYAGAAFLIALGIRTIFKSRPPTRPQPTTLRARPRPRAVTTATAYLRGFSSMCSTRRHR